MNVSDAVRTKRAVREFKPEPLPKEAILAIVNAGRRAQSSKNTQPWSFIAITDRATLQALAKTGVYADHLSGAALAVAIAAPPPEVRFSVMLDVGQAIAYMQLAAWELGIGSCIASIYEPDKARKILGYPQDLEMHIALSFGYPADESALTRPNKKGGRRPMEEVVHWEKW